MSTTDTSTTSPVDATIEWLAENFMANPFGGPGPFTVSRQRDGITISAPDGRAVRITVNDGPDVPLTFAALAQENRSRCERWHPGFPDDGWSGADWATAMAGEAGEACNVVKKIRRADFGAASPRDPDRDTLLRQLGAELADVVIYLDLLAQHYGLDLAAHVTAKFNVVSEREGFPERLPEPSIAEVFPGAEASAT